MGIHTTCEVLAAFSHLGCTSFGGPVAHLGYFRLEFVERRKWLSEEDFADLVALCQFLPGPASSQLAFALGMRRGGLPGALAASVGFTLPSALLMILFAYGLVALGGGAGSGWVHGLKLAAVAIVGHAVFSMARQLCPDMPRLAMAAGAAALAAKGPGVMGPICAMVLGGALGWYAYRHSVLKQQVPEASVPTHHHVAAGLAWALFGLLLVALPALTRVSENGSLALVDSFYRAGSLVFGGGHVVLPLLRAEVVPPGWIEDHAFLAGYGAAQALPGPLFTFAAYLGASATVGPGGWRGGLLAVCAIFLPALLLVGGTLPLWQVVRRKAWMRAALRGTNAAVVGILATAFVNPVCREGLSSGTDATIATVAFLLVQFTRTPVWLVVALCAAAGMIVP